MISGGCPFAFPAKNDKVEGVERISRHPSLWALGVFGMGYAASAVYLTEFCFGAFPVVFTIIGGAHQDHRHRADGKLTPERDALTSHMPFGALIEGRQSWTELQKEVKWENMAVGASVAMLLFMRRAHLARKLAAK